MAQNITIEKVIEHHLTQNIGQKLTPHLIMGLTLLISQNVKSEGLLAEHEVKNSEPGT